MGLLDNMEPQVFESQCKLGKLMTELEPSDQQILTDALNDFTKWNNRQLTLALNQRGIAIVVETVRSHRLGHCACGRNTK